VGDDGSSAGVPGDLVGATILVRGLSIALDRDDGDDPPDIHTHSHAGAARPCAGTRRRRLATSDQRPATSDQRPATGDRRPATGDRRPATGDRRPATGDRRLATGEASMIIAFADDSSTEQAERGAR
jgi:hypothetical protein